jgi:hypothetical protein
VPRARAADVRDVWVHVHRAADAVADVGVIQSGWSSRTFGTNVSVSPPVERSRSAIDRDTRSGHRVGRPTPRGGAIPAAGWTPRPASAILTQSTWHVRHRRAGRPRRRDTATPPDGVVPTLR